MRIALAAGGTAGHIFPALATLGALRASGGPVEARFFGPDNRGERALVQGHEVPFETIPAAPLRGRSPVALARGLARTALGIATALRAVRRFDPNVMLSTGGYGSFPASVAARVLRLPLVVFLPDVEPGLAVRAESRLATLIAAATEGALPRLPAAKAVVSGYPVRDAFRTSREDARAALGWSDGERVLLVAAGTQGARAINRAVWEALPSLCEAAHVVHVTGSAAADEAAAEREALPEELRDRYEPAPFRDDLPVLMVAADLAVMRAGASTLGELPAAGLPAVLVPGTFAGGHQRENARWLAERGGAVLLEEADLDALEGHILGLLGDDRRRAGMAEAARAAGHADGAARLATILREVAA